MPAHQGVTETYTKVTARHIRRITYWNRANYKNGIGLAGLNKSLTIVVNETILSSISDQWGLFMKSSFRRAALAAVAIATIGVAAPATASTSIAWTGSDSFDTAVQTFSAVNASSLSFSGSDTSYGIGIAGPFAHTHSFGGASDQTWTIALDINGTWTTVFSQFLPVGGETSLVGLGNITFGAGSVDAIQLSCDFCSSQTYHQFTNSSFTLAGGAVPEPATWAMMLMGFGMAGFGLRNRRKPTVSVTYA